MKKLYTILLGTAFAALFVACEGLNTMPEFEPEESFASFPTATFSLNEDKGQVVIPVEIASIQPLETVVSYKIIDGSAKNGVDYKDSNKSAVLNFDGKTRSQNIVIDIIPRVGEYTGDLDFTVELVSATGLKLSMEKVCSVKILDLDHPLAEILGDYAGSAVSSYDGEVSWTMHLLKDPKDVKVVWMQGITDEVAAANQLYYANVNFDEDDNIIGITFPAGQIVPYSSSYDLWLVGNTAGSGSYWPQSSLTWLYSDGKFIFDAEGNDCNSIGILAVSHADNTSIAGWWNRYDVPPSYTKL